MKKRIHVNQHNVWANAKGADLPVITIETHGVNIKCNEVITHGENRVVNSPDKPLSCGEKVWVEITVDIEVVR